MGIVSRHRGSQGGPGRVGRSDSSREGGVRIDEVPVVPSAHCLVGTLRLSTLVLTLRASAGVQREGKGRSSRDPSTTQVTEPTHPSYPPWVPTQKWGTTMDLEGRL